jgi:cobalamin biosynthesis protein CobD/CbiB
MRGLALPALVFEVLLYLLVSLFETAVSDQLSLILGFQILSVLSFLAQDVKRNVFGRTLHVSELINHAADLSAVLLKDRIESSRDILSALVSRQLNVLDHGILLGCLKDVGAALTPNIVPFEIQFLESLARTDQICDDLSP